MKELYHSGVLSILPSIQQVINQDILYKLRDEEIKGIKSRIDYLDRSKSGTKYQLFIDSPLQDTLDKLATKEPAFYGQYKNAVELQKMQFKAQLGAHYYNKIDVYDSTSVLKKDVRYNNLCEVLNDDYTDFKAGSIEDGPGSRGGRGTWFVFKRNSCDAIRVMTYENAKDIINNHTDNFYFLHGDLDGIADAEVANFQDAVTKILSKKVISVDDFNTLFGSDKNKYQEHLLNFFESKEAKLFICADNGLFIIKPCDIDIIEEDFDFREEFLDDEVGDTIWDFMAEKTNEYKFMRYVDSLIVQTLNNLCSVGGENRSIDTWGIADENEDIRTYLKILLDKPLPPINVPLSDTGRIISEAKNLLWNGNAANSVLDDVCVMPEFYSPEETRMLF